ncbi:MAG: hypothetical protein OEY70_04945 [Acidimicrobiia bacterium]|nr:hypothetical protein [Acidimicrobiia bacterium]
MGSEELLKSACELSYAVARDGAEATPPTEPPAAMRSFLYVAQLPGRALSVAQQAIEEDPSFRRRVAERATESEVGRAGFLWLNRPIGWAAEFEELTMGNGSSGGDDNGNDEADVRDAELDELSWASIEDAEDDRETVAAVSLDDDIYDEQEALEDERLADQPVAVSAGGSFGSIDLFGTGDLPTAAPAARGRSEANAIEDELMSLRGLVDRLSNERKAVSSSVRQAEQDLAKAKSQPSVFESDVYTLQSELEAARSEVDAARRERDNAIRQHSESLTRQLELERELDRARELRAQIEREHADADAGIVDIKESLARTEASLNAVQADCDELSGLLAGTRTENEDLKLQVQRLTDMGASQTKALEAQYKALQTESDALRNDKDTLASRLAAAETELDNTKAQLGQIGNQAAEAKSLVDALTEEKIDLASRLADTEAMLETTRAQLAAVKADAEVVAADLSNIRAHRDGLATQVDELHGGLTEALGDLARVRETSDADRAALKEVRAERDLLRVRVGSLEQIEKGLEAKLANLAAERDAFALRTDQTKAELADRERQFNALETERAELADELASIRDSHAELEAERNTLRVDIEALTGRATELELARDGLAVQVEQLTEENLAIQAQMVDKDRQQQEAADNQGRALSELAHRLAVVENDRNRMETDLQQTEAQLAEALDAVGKAMETAEKAQSQLAALEAEGAGGAAASTILSASASASALAEPPAVAGAPSALAGLDTVATVKAADAAPVVAEPAPSLLGALADPARGLFDEPDGGGLTVVDVSSAEPATAGGLVIESWPPPPGPPSAAVPPAGAPTDIPSGSTAAVPPTAAQPGDERAPRRIWGLGGRFRNEADDPDRTDRAHELEAPVGPAGELAPPAIDDGLAALAPAGQLPPPPAGSGPLSSEPVTVAGDGLVNPPPPPAADPDDDLDSLSSELSMAVGDSSLAPASDDEDLDEISKLIKQTVTDFDPTSLQGHDANGGTDAEPRRRGFSRRLFRTGEQERIAESSPLNTPPPSVFGDDVRLPGSGVDPDQTLVVKGGPLDGPEAVFDRAGGVIDAAGGGTVRPGRRQIDIPADLDDEVERARHVVSSPDVVLLVDGDSVAKMGWPSLPVAQQRDALVSYLADLSSSTGASPDVVFDGRIGEEESLPASRAVRIRLSTPPTEPAAALDELVDAYPEQWPIAVVTDDDDLARSARDRGAAVLNNGQLLDLFIV